MIGEMKYKKKKTQPIANSCFKEEKTDIQKATTRTSGQDGG